MALAKAPKDDFGGTPSAKTQGKVLGVPAWSSLENLAACKASIEALELHQAQMNGTAKSKATEAMLESLATASFPSWLETVADEHPGVWRDLPTKAGNMWTIETSKAMRTSKGGIYHRWKSVLQPYMLGVINPAYASCLNEDGSAPAGMTREHIIAKIKHAIWIYKVTEKPKRRKNKGAKAANKGDGDDDDDDDDDKEAAGGEAGEENGQGGVHQDAETDQASAAPPRHMPAKWDGGPILLAWLELGPMGLGLKELASNDGGRGTLRRRPVDAMRGEVPRFFSPVVLGSAPGAAEHERDNGSPSAEPDGGNDELARKRVCLEERKLAAMEATAKRERKHLELKEREMELKEKQFKFEREREKRKLSLRSLSAQGRLICNEKALDLKNAMDMFDKDVELEAWRAARQVYIDFINPKNSTIE